MASWMPLTCVNIIRDLDIVVFSQMYFKLLNVHALAMTSIVWNPLLYFWMSKVRPPTISSDFFARVEASTCTETRYVLLDQRSQQVRRGPDWIAQSMLAQLERDARLQELS